MVGSALTHLDISLGSRSLPLLRCFAPTLRRLRSVVCDCRGLRLFPGVSPLLLYAGCPRAPFRCLRSPVPIPLGPSHPLPGCRLGIRHAARRPFEVVVIAAGKVGVTRYLLLLRAWLLPLACSGRVSLRARAHNL